MSITTVPGVRVGHWQDERALTGCTVILLPTGSQGSVFVAGGAPATRETDALRPGTIAPAVHAVVLTGGSAYGLAAADGVLRWCEENGIGLPTPGGLVPIVPAAAIYDLAIGDGSVRPGAAEGYAACVAVAGETEEGNVGAGMGATVGKLAGIQHQSKGGLGTDARSDGALVVGALAVVNALGDVVEGDGSVIAGARAEPGTAPPPLLPATTICCVASNAALPKTEAERVARAVSAALARAIRPVYTSLDGDTVFVVGTGEIQAAPEQVAALGVDALESAIRRAVRAARSVPDAPAMGTRGGL